MTEKMRIIIEPPKAHPDFLTIQDAMEHILDYFKLTSLSVKPEDAQNVAWKLVSITMQSPLDCTAEAYSIYPQINIDPIAKKQKEILTDGMKSILKGVTPLEWTSKEANNIVSRIKKKKSKWNW